ncbi:hypothetical protein PVAP13_3KG250600 [Panicum virgatum]|uniref:Uncharacterized protein n=1 Tax=Panicum virgatum TaxID=38727 RepID=A0A8T0V2I4_PANVG|nr:hypothetical protein PVAP13_3KG250600 [Panicum virgatum]
MPVKSRNPFARKASASLPRSSTRSSSAAPARPLVQVQPFLYLPLPFQFHKPCFVLIASYCSYASNARSSKFPALPGYRSSINYEELILGSSFCLSTPTCSPSCLCPPEIARPCRARCTRSTPRRPGSGGCRMRGKGD